MGMVVRAKCKREKDPSEPREVAGYYAHRRRYEGDIFEIESEQSFSGNWMERVSGEASPEAVPETRDLRSRLAREHKAAQRMALP